MSTEHKKTRLSWFIARRYLSARKQGRFLSFITWIALGGITVGVTALIVVLGVMNGMQEDLQGKILGSSPHVVVLERGPALRMNDWRTVADSIRKIPEVEAVSPFVLTSVVVVRGEDYVQPADLYGVSLEGSPDEAVTRMEEEILQGIHALEETKSGLPPVVLGLRLAERMAVFPGDSLLIFSLENFGIDPMGGYRPAVRQFEVTGTFETGMYDYDLNNMYAPLGWVQGILGIQGEDQVSGLGVRISDPWRATEVSAEVRSRLGGTYFAESWTTTNQSLFSALQLEKLAMGVILSLIVMVAAFNHRQHPRDGRCGPHFRDWNPQIDGDVRWPDPSDLRSSGTSHRNPWYGAGHWTRPFSLLDPSPIRDHQDSSRRVLHRSTPRIDPRRRHRFHRGSQHDYLARSYDLPGASGLTASARGSHPP